MSKTENAILEDDLLVRGVKDLVDPEGHFKKKLSENPNQVVIKFGVDPTRPDIHLGHAVVFRKLRKFQDLGCKVIFLVGDFTSLIGDPTGNSKVRPEIEQKEIEENMKTYLDQVGKILLTDPKVFAWIRNSDWYYGATDLAEDPERKVEMNIEQDGKSLKASLPGNSFLAKSIVYNETRMQKKLSSSGKIWGLTVLGLLWTLKHVTHSRLIERDMFQVRIKNGDELYMHEMLYPVLQGVDSFMIANIFGACDLEVGGSDQTFNMLMGRDVMKMNKQAPQAVLSFEILEGLDGKEKMSKSLDNYIAITDTPEDMYGKIMSLPDTLISKYFKLCTYTPMSVISEIEKSIESGKENPKNIKMRLAREIVEMYHGREKANLSEESFVKTFSEGGIPDSITEVSVSKGSSLVGVLVEQALVSSKSDFRRLVEGKAIEQMERGEVVESVDSIINESGTYRIGKKRFIKITVL